MHNIDILTFTFTFTFAEGAAAHHPAALTMCVCVPCVCVVHNMSPGRAVCASCGCMLQGSLLTPLWQLQCDVISELLERAESRGVALLP